MGELESDNVKVDPQGRYVIVEVNPKLYKQHVVMRAADDLIHDRKDYDVIIGGDPETQITAKFIPKSGHAETDELLRVAYRFNTLLVTTSGKG